MNIILLVNKLTDGGAERVASLWATGFVNSGYKVTIVIKNSNAPITYSVPIEAQRYRYNESPWSRFKVKRIFDKFLWLRQIVNSISADVIISNDPDMSLAIYIATLGIHIPIIHTAHNAFERPSSAPMSFRTRFEKFYRNKLYDHVTVLTQADKDVIGKRLKHVTVLPNPLTFNPIESMPPKEKIVLASGRLDEWHVKGFDILLKAWAALDETNEGWKLIISGGSKTGKGLEYLKQLCLSLGIQNTVEFVGYQTDMLPYYRNAAIYVLSSRYEGFGMVLIEAMSQGCACIACDYKGRQKEILGENAGIICQPEDVISLSSSIKKLIIDEKLRASLGSEAIKRSDFFSIDNTMLRWNNIMKKVL